MKIYLSTQPAPEQWGNNALISFNDEGIIIHLRDNALNSIQQAARKIKNQGITTVSLIGNAWMLEECWAFQQGFASVKNCGKINFPKLTKQEQSELDARIRCTQFTKELINAPSDVVTPEVLVHKAVTFIEEFAKNSISVKVISGEALKEQNYQGIWAVGKGAVNSPAMLQLDYNPTNDENAPVLACLVGKGITFDTGGYSLKPSNSMETMRTDMGGAALLTGALGLAIARGLKQRVKLYLCCAENSISGQAMKLGDIIHYSNGVSVEVLNTDAEGRLVLADGLIEADKQNPNYIIDCATLTGAAKMAVGNDYHSILSIDDQLIEQLLTSAKAENEKFWRLPFEEFHRNQTASSFADIANVGSLPAGVGAGASTATAFLSYFVKNYAQNWLHIDCSATFRKSPNELWATGATGIGVKTLANLLLKL
ncbi:aminopeptidase PepB [Pasteurella atlantica]|uniref:Aminopeptidase PepB n=2 Tax=Pasteurellaceae TaxID=712 RepID=A0ACC6HNP4_9PAST|nr:aminopeptidase PepB [Pasteurella atlantica]MDP8052449.1 aminopeptidase PepB [Pasteurella atlantica]MDP8100588.1 aminopeptidase PepB [Pasteurella atlantica]MDP8105728.1 aminopeptidase PepB [Pasteurella atlantica]MDP8149160.1 aminopeptidase PepB [Pasteurella atlantica]